MVLFLELGTGLQGPFILNLVQVNSIRFKEERKWFDSGLGLDWAGSGSKNQTMGRP